MTRSSHTIGRVDEPGRYLVYSVTKTFLGVLCLRLELELDAPAATWLDDRALPQVSLRQLLNHTSGIPDYGRVPEYTAAVRERPSEPWDDEELLARALARRPDFEPGSGWAYSNTGFLLVRRIVDAAAPGGFAGALERELLAPLGLSQTSLALELADLEGLAPALSTQVGEGEHDVRGRYHPRWVGHRTLASTHADQRRFWTALARGELCDLATLTTSIEIGFAAPGFVHPSYGLGVMTDPGRPDGLLIGHGGGGPGYVAAAFAVIGDEPGVAVLLSADEREDVQAAALRRLQR
jgi:D-alanyl-D-alanine carboxypeptidase